MTPQEQDMIQGLVDRVNQTQLPEKDAQAEQLLAQTLGRNPDALYILTQTVLVQKYALDQAQKQLADLRSQLDQGRQQQPQQEHHTSFLGTLLGRNDPPPPPPPPGNYQGNPSSGQQQYAPVPNYGPAGYPQGGGQPGGYAQPQAPGSIFGGGAPAGGGFLRSALQTATGVAAGALAFQGIESLMHGFGGGGGGFGGGGQGLGSFGGGPREEIVNNYYGDSGGDRDRGDSSLSSDIEDRRNDNSGLGASDSADDRFADTGSSDDDTSLGSGDDTSSLDSGDGDDTSSFDSGDDGGDSSSFDSGGGDDSSFS